MLVRLCPTAYVNAFLFCGETSTEPLKATTSYNADKCVGLQFKSQIFCSSYFGQDSVPNNTLLNFSMQLLIEHL